MKDNQTARYERLWQRVEVLGPQNWSTWEIVKDFQDKQNLEIGPGKYPRIPIEDGYFIDISEAAIEALNERGGRGRVGSAESLLFEDGLFDLVVATDVLEHIDDDRKSFAEISRVLKPSGFFLFSVPLRQELYSEMDAIAGHQRRYEIKDLVILLEKNNFKVIKYRKWSLYLKILSVWGRIVKLGRLAKASYQQADFLKAPKFLVNFLVRSHAWLDRNGAPDWQEDIEKLANFKGEWIMLFCQKVE